MDEKKTALLKYFNIPTLDKNNMFVANVFTSGECIYLVLSNEEANNAMYEYVKNNMCVFDAEFILNCTVGYNKELVESLSAMKECIEKSNSFLYAFVEHTCGVDYFVEKVIDQFGRAEFLSPVYEEEIQISENVFIYRLL